MRIHFDLARVRIMLEHSIHSRKQNLLFGQRKSAAGLWLIGDEGIYLMSNGDPKLHEEDGKTGYVCYADECNPETMEFDAWWAAKNAIWGGDDGSEIITARSLQECLATYPTTAKRLILDVTHDGIGLLGYVTEKPKTAKAAPRVKSPPAPAEGLRDSFVIRMAAAKAKKKAKPA